MKNHRCRYCQQVFQAAPYHPQQLVCRQPACQRQRRRDYHRQKIASDPVYQQVCLDSPRNAALRAWLAVRGTVSVPELFVNARGGSLTRSGVEYILRKHARTASQRCPSLTTKRVFPHVLRHTCALSVLQATKDLRKVSLWLGHAHMQTTEIYTRADPSVKLEALESIMPPKLRSGRFKATDKLIESLKSCSVTQSKKARK